MKTETATRGGELRPAAAVSQPSRQTSRSVGVVTGGSDRCCPNIFLSVHPLMDADRPETTKDSAHNDLIIIINSIFNHKSL